MLKLTKRLTAVAMLTGLILQTFVVDAGLRRMRMFRSNCAMPSCAAPSCAGCFAPVGCQGPYGGIWGCSGPSYIAVPPMVSACSAPMWGCSGPACYGPACYQPGCGYGAGYGPGNMSMMADPFYGNAYMGGSNYGIGSAYGFSSPSTNPMAYGMMGSVPPAAASFGGFGSGTFGVGMTSAVPPYYAPMPAQYAPIPPAPAADLVW